jgi:enoyl-CoA hydratase
VIDEGYAATFGQGMAIERARADASNGSVSAHDIEARREAVRARAQGQS